MKKIATYTGVLAALFLGWVSATSRLESRIKDMEYAYSMGTAIQFMGEGAMVLCHGKADYIAIQHGPGAAEFVREYVEAACS